jgi:hypothetical protein
LSFSDGRTSFSAGDLANDMPETIGDPTPHIPAVITDTGVSPDQAARLAADNYRGVVEHLCANRDRAFDSREALRSFVEDVGRRVNSGITTPDALHRQHDSEKFASYTRVADLPAASRDFFTRLPTRLTGPTADPVETAAWVEYGMELTDHLGADGCGKSAKAVAAWVLMRHGYDLPSYPTQRADQFAHAPKLPRSTTPGVDAFQLREWLDYYTTLVGGGHD